MSKQLECPAIDCRWARTVLDDDPPSTTAIALRGHVRTHAAEDLLRTITHQQAQIEALQASVQDLLRTVAGQRSEIELLNDQAKGLR